MKLYKRNPSDSSAPWYVQLQHRKRKYQRSTGESQHYKAREVAAKIVSGIKGGGLPMPPIGNKEIPTIHQIVNLYLNRAIHCKKKTARTCARRLRIMVHTCGISVDSPITVLTGNVVARFQAERLKDIEDDAAKVRATITCNSMVIQARSVFARRMEPIYEDAGFIIPDLSSFRRYPLLKTPSKGYKPLPDATVRKLAVAAQVLKITDPACYAAFCMALYLGMRSKEMINAKWDWVCGEGDKTYIDVPSMYSKGGESRQIPIDLGILAEIRSVSNGEYMIPANSRNQRELVVTRRHSAWLRKNGCNRGKTNHELRKLFGSYIATKHGLFAAQKLLGHSSPLLTSQYYAGLVELPPGLASMNRSVAPSSAEGGVSRGD